MPKSRNIEFNYQKIAIFQLEFLKNHSATFFEFFDISMILHASFSSNFFALPSSFDSK